MGERFLAWLSYINDHRPVGQKISLTSPETTIAYPIDQPTLSNPDIILARFNELKSTIPQWMSKIIFEKEDFISELPVTDREFIKIGFQLDRNYQGASRWLLQEPYLSEYGELRTKDVRGYYFLTHDKDLETKFQNWTDQSEEIKNSVLGNLKGMCLNTETAKKCESKISEAKTEGDKLRSLYQTYLPKSTKLWNSFFELGEQREDIEWTEANQMKVPFQKPETNDILNFLKDNIEDEWRFNDWKLTLDFTQGGFGTPKVEFVAGATPHVESLAGNTITMDANSPLTEYGVQCTIRHEFGHVLGLPDCYVEFYDSDQKAMVNYQLDITNLMCSRRGHIKQIHVDALKAAYFQGSSH